MRIAVEGCGHGQLHEIYAAFAKDPQPVDLLIICGDFQAVRNEQDLSCLACPPKYRKMGDFVDYFSGQAEAPVLTIFIGGNHEAANHLNDLYYGGWVCKNIYYLGHAGVIRVGGLRIAGISGIFYGRDYRRGYYEQEPYTQDMIRSAYHYREFEIEKLKKIKEDVDIFVSHEWPTGIYNFGDKEALLKWKPYFRDEINRNVLGSKPLEVLLHTIKPKRWFAAHMHAFFEARVPHPSSGKVTDFMALDKCLPKRQFMRIMDIPTGTDAPIKLEYDPEWISILKHSQPFISRTPGQWNISKEFFEAKTSTVSLEDPSIPIPVEYDLTTARQQTTALKRNFLSPPVESQTQYNPEEIELE